MAPQLYRALTPDQPRRPSGWVWGTERFLGYAAAVAGPVGLSLTQIGEVLIAVATENQRRTLAPIADALAGELRTTAQRRRISARPTWRREHAADAAGLGRRFTLWAATEGLGVHVPTLQRMLFRAARCLSMFESMLADDSPRAVCVATQHGVEVRALLISARKLGIPTSYVPHAPVAANPIYADLPFDAAGLRGSAEVEHYEALGVAADSLEVVGNPAVELPPPPPIDSTLGPVFAVSPWPVEDLRRMIGLLSSVLPTGVVVAPHPGAGTAMLKGVVPSGWEVWQGGRTFDLLAKGPWCVLQSSSGVAWEALALGLPTVEFALMGAQPNYPLIQSPPVHFVHDRQSLIAALVAAASEAADPALRASFFDWAYEWCERTGTAAAESGARLVVEMVERGPRWPPLLDRYQVVRPRG